MAAERHLEDFCSRGGFGLSIRAAASRFSFVSVSCFVVSVLALDSKVFYNRPRVDFLRFYG